MKKWVIGALLAATAASPALAQDDEDGRRNRAERRAERQEQRAERQEFRAERAPRAERAEQPRFQPAESAQRVQRDRPGRRVDTGVEAQATVDAQAGGRRQERRREAAPVQPQVGVDWNANAAARGGRRFEQERPATVELNRRNPSYDATRPDQARRDRDRWDNRSDRGDQNRWDDRNGRNDRDRWENRNDRDGWNGGRANDRRDWNGNRNWNRTWRQDNRYDWNRYRSGNRNLFRLPRYYAPYGWNYGYRRFSIGVTLSSILWGQNYWIDDPWYYRLPPAYGPYRWVRYYNDALLVDVRSGYVVDTVYDIFY